MSGKDNNQSNEVEPQMILRSQSKRTENNVTLTGDEDVSFRTPTNTSATSDMFRQVFARQEEKMERLRSESLQRDNEFMHVIQNLSNRLEKLSENSNRLNSTAANTDSTRPSGLPNPSQSTIDRVESQDTLSNHSSGQAINGHMPQRQGQNNNGGIPQRPPPHGYPPMQHRPVPNQMAFGHQRYQNFTPPRDLNRYPRGYDANRSTHRVVFQDIEINGTERLSIDYLPASVVDVKSTRPGKPLMMSGGIVLPDTVPSGTMMKLMDILIEHENEYYKGKATALQYLKDSILTLHPDWNVVGEETSHFDATNTSVLNMSGDQSKLAMDMVKKQQMPNDLYFDGLNDLEDYFETCESYMIGLPTVARAMVLRKGFKGEALNIFKELPHHLAFDDVAIKDHFRSFYAKSQSTRYKDKYENMQLKAGMSYSLFAHNLRSAYIADNPSAVHRIVEKVVKVQYLRKLPKGCFDHVQGYYDMDMLSIADVLDKTRAYKRLVYTNTAPTAKVMVADSSKPSDSSNTRYYSSDRKNPRNHSDDRRSRPHDKRDYSDRRRNFSGDRRDHSGDRRDHSGDRRDHSGDRRDHSRDRRNPSNDRRYNASSDRRFNNPSYNQKGYSNGNNNRQSNQNNKRYNSGNERKFHSSDRQFNSGGRRDQSGDRRNNSRFRDYSPNNESMSKDRSRDRSPSDMKQSSYRNNSPYGRDDRSPARGNSESRSPNRFDHTRSPSRFGGDKSYNSGSYNGSRSNSPQRPKDFTCWFCGKKGHFAADCWSKVQKSLYSVMNKIDDTSNATNDTQVSNGPLNA